MSTNLQVGESDAAAAELVRSDRRASAVRWDRWLRYGPVLVLVAATLVIGTSEDSHTLFILNSVLLAVVGASALNFLMGTGGQVSIGNAAFLVVGAFSAAYFVRAGVPFPVDVILAGGVGALAGLIVGLPSLRIKGLYLALATLAAHFIVLQLARQYQSNEVGSSGFLFDPIKPASDPLTFQRQWLPILLCVAAAALLLSIWLVGGKWGRAWRQIRDHELAAPTLGIRAGRYKLAAFMISSAMIAVQGALGAHYAGNANVDRYTLALAISYLAMVMIGGLDSAAGTLIGAVVIVWLPYLAQDVGGFFFSGPESASQSAHLSQVAYGALVLLFVLYAPNGMVGWIRRIPQIGKALSRRKKASTS